MRQHHESERMGRLRSAGGAQSLSCARRLESDRLQLDALEGRLFRLG